MKFQTLLDHLDPKPEPREPMTLDLFLSLLNPSEIKEDSKNRKRKD